MSKHARTLHGLRAPYLAEYFGLWCIESGRFQSAVDRVNRMDLRLHLQHQREIAAARSASGESSPTSYGYNASGGTAVVSVSGSLMKAESSMDASTSTAMLRRTCGQLKGDSDVQRVMFVFDSPGGTAAGTQDAADDVAALAAVKPCAAYIEDLGCSAAYWIASQCGTISTNRTGIVGSIGTYCAVYDTSAEAAMNGIKVHVISTGKLKGAGVDGSVITPEQLAAWQTMVDDLNGDFLAAVARGRNMSMSQVETLADGGVHVGQAAMDRGLVDHVESLDQAIERLQSTRVSASRPAPRRATAMLPIDVAPRNDGLGTQILNADGTSAGTLAEPDAIALTKSPAPETIADGSSAGSPTQQATDTPGASAPGPDAATQEKATMPTPTPAAPAPTADAASKEPKPASIAELQAAFPKDPSFALESAKAALTLMEAKAAYADVLQKRLDDAEASAAEQAKADAQAKEEKKDEPHVPGVKGLSETRFKSERLTAEGEHEFEQRVNALTAKGMAKDRAVMKVAASDPDLRADYREFAKSRAQEFKATRAAEQARIAMSV